MKTLFLGAALLVSIASFAQPKTSKTPSLRLIRNATLVIEYAGKKILVDPMLSSKGAFESFAGVEKNPTVELKMPVKEIVEGVDLVLVTHTHVDHFDPAASNALVKSVQVLNQPADKAFFTKEGFTKANVLDSSTDWDGIRIQRVDAQHGSGKVLEMMGKTSGFILTAKNEPTIYIVGDGILTEDIVKNIKKFNPDYIVVNSGGAFIPGFETSPILMDEVQTMALIRESGKAKVIAVHMDALDHCRTSRAKLIQKANEMNIEMTKLIIPQDGEVVHLKR
ncbi:MULTISPECIES: MBL fold metallo-hydrolase [Dyadobacter]|uniref:MBL fold metallo-hydrolase n=1 Tax=Dyadobacter chenhuakuii TaxID=2909339 RepID=A0ABY4XP99_9BACT|nr:MULTISPECIES: MBL fold metallo-hydrolase [Dyadobacter]MCF2493437.1 MBL fold metallo-hydrolase [Dyadobacter chenhuakuii]MCF2517181.1 MBL fold metallo-hydrolase [Dyadobacter sp. CY351]USJ32286.1 MBL fold metallo-hydrolase [Dyadobacter chenhuakuii]